MARYGDIKVPFREDDKLNPVDPYGVSKVAAERILEILCNTHDVEYNIAVPHNIIGPKQKYDDPYRNVVSIMINLMLQKRKPIIKPVSATSAREIYIAKCTILAATFCTMFVEVGNDVCCVLRM